MSDTTFRLIPARKTEVPRAILRRVRFVDLARCANDTSGNPRGVYLLRSARGRIEAVIPRGWDSWSDQGDLAWQIHEALHGPTRAMDYRKGSKVRGGQIFDVPVRQAIWMLDWHRNVLYQGLPKFEVTK